MRKFIKLSMAFVLLASGLCAQSNESGLAGTWVVDKDFVKTRGNQTWIISVSSGEVRIEKVLHFNNTRREIVFAVGGAQVKAVSGTGKTSDAKSYWKDKKLIREYSYKKEGSTAGDIFGPQYATARVTEMYYLSKDGKKLIFRRDDDSVWPNRNTPAKMGRGFEDKIILRRKD